MRAGASCSLQRTTSASSQPCSEYATAAYPDGELSHSPLLALLDREGVIVTRSEPTAAELDTLIAATTRVARTRD